MKLHLVPARTGVVWVRQGIQVFVRQPLPLAILFCMTMASMFLLSAIPLLGTLAALVLQPSVTLVMMLASAESAQGKVPLPSLVLATFRAGPARLRSMLILGLIYASTVLLVVAAASLFDDSPELDADGKPTTSVTRKANSTEPSASTAAVTAPASSASSSASSASGSSTDAQDEINKVVANPTSLMGQLLVPLLFLPFSLLFWHAPGLVYWYNVPPVKALFFSVVACVRNIGAFATFALSWLGVSLFAGLVLSVLALVLRAVGLPDAVAAMLIVPTGLILATMFLASVVFTFRDSFVPPEQYGHTVDGPTQEI